MRTPQFAALMTRDRAAAEPCDRAGNQTRRNAFEKTRSSGPHPFVLAVTFGPATPRLPNLTWIFNALSLAQFNALPTCCAAA